MSLSKSLLHHYSQAQRALTKASNNNYSDKRKQDYQDSLFSLLKAISSQMTSASTLDESEIWEYKNELHFIFKSLEVLDSSILNLIPHETVYCLNKALNDWKVPSQDFIIVTSLINDVGGFSFDPYLAHNDILYSRIENKYKIKFEGRLVQINIPKALSRDYLISGFHYHELGHFIDSKFSITNAITQQLFADLGNKQITPYDFGILSHFLPLAQMNQQNVRRIFQICLNHIGEYFCDLFSAQYAGDSMAGHLHLITFGNGGGITHPATPLRNEVVSDFLGGRPNIILSRINTALSAILNKSIDVRFDAVDETDFYDFLPPIIGNDRQLHGIFSSGMKAWNSDWLEFETKMNLSSQPEAERIYNIVNNLIEKSIGNYMVQEKWNQNQS
jgi:hypothetical protein